jgi:dTDP-4-amino-4,6-dideoxygalactose transaminase
MHLQAPYVDSPRAALDVSDSVWDSIVTLPCSTGITDEELANVVSAVKAALHQ